MVSITKTFLPKDSHYQGVIYVLNFTPQGTTQQCKIIERSVKTFASLLHFCVTAHILTGQLSIVYNYHKK